MAGCQRDDLVHDAWYDTWLLRVVCGHLPIRKQQSAIAVSDGDLSSMRRLRVTDLSLGLGAVCEIQIKIK